MAADKDWFKTWFSTHYYDVLYRHRNKDEAAEFIDSLIRHLKPADDATILDAGCGKGRHAVYLAGKGFHVTGVDLSFKNIRNAKKEETDHLSFFQHDMRKVFRVNFFDFIFNFYTSFGYYENDKDNICIIQSFANELKEGGMLVIDFMNVNTILQKNTEDETRVIDGIEFTIRKKMNNGFVVKEIHVKENGRTELFIEKVKAITLAEFKNYFSQCNLHIQDIFGDYSLNPFQENNSERLILIAKK